MRNGLVGRAGEVAALDRLRAKAAGGSGSAVLLAGEAGIGKTAVVEEAVFRAAAAGAVVLTGRAEPDEGAPAYWPWTRLLESARASGGPPAAPLPVEPSPAEPSPAAALPAGALPAGALPAGPSAAGLSPVLLEAGEWAGEPAAAVRFRIARRTIRALRDAGPLVLVLEDLQWADPGSVALLRGLCAEITDSSILLIGTVRQPDDRFPPADLTGLPGVEVLPLGPLGPRAVGAYLDRHISGAVHPSWAAVVHRLAGGNPLYVRELTRLLARGDRLRRPATDVDLPDGLRRLVNTRTAQLSVACREVLGGAAALGAEIDVPVLRAAAPDPSSVDALLAEAVDAGVLVDDPWRPATLRFAHDLVRQARYGELSRGERIAWHRRIADALDGEAAAGGRRVVGIGATPAEIARHRVRAAVDAGSRHAADVACRDAARAAGRALDYADAVRWYGRAVAYVPADPELLLARADAAYRDGQLDVALADCAAVLGHAEDRGDAGLAAAAALVVRGLGGAQVAVLITLCERALALLDGHDDAEHAQVLAQYAFLLAEIDHDRAEPISRAAMAMAGRTGRADALVAAIHARHEVLEPVDDLDEVLELGARSCALARDSGRPDAELWGRVWRIDAFLMVGDLPAADAETRLLGALADRLGWPMARWHLLRVQAARALLAGRFADGETLAAQARDAGIRFQDDSAGWLYLAFMSGSAAQTARYGHWSGEPADTSERYLDVPIAAAQICQIWMLTGDRDRTEEAWRHLRAALPALRPSGRRVFILEIAGEVAVWLGDLETARHCYDNLVGYAHLYMNNSTSCHGAIARPLGMMAAALGDLAAADRHLTDAVAMEERIGAAPFLAQAHLAHARVHLARGDRRRAQESADRAAVIARRLGMPGVAADATALADEASGRRGGAGTLTAREREIAVLVADGLANRAIAERLVLSERTVETHVRNVLAKLELNNRTQIAAWSARLRTTSA